MSRITLSKLELLTRCGWWARGEAVWAEHVSDDAALGTEVDKLFMFYVEEPNHRFNASYLEHDRTDPIFARCREWIDANRSARFRTQVVFAYDPYADTGREIARPSDAPARFYAEPEWRERVGIEPQEICGAADLFSLGQDDGGPFVAIDDLKVLVGAPVKDATSQLAGLALAACRAYGIERARVRTLIASEARVEEVPVWLDAFDLDALAGELRARVDAIESSSPTPGEWCTDRYCPAIASCPATSRELASAEQLISIDRLTTRDDAFRLKLHVDSPDHAAWLLARARAVERVCEDIRACVSAYVGPEGVRLEDGSMLQPTFRQVARTSAGALEELAKRYGATDEDLASCVKLARESAGIRVVKGQSRKGRAA